MVGIGISGIGHDSLMEGQEGLRNLTILVPGCQRLKLITS